MLKIKNHTSFFTDDSGWKSNQHIYRQIISSLQHIDKQNIDLTRTLFILSTPDVLIKYLIQKDLAKYKAYIFFISGDFTFYTPEWLELCYLLKNKKILFITASIAQKKLVSKFFNLEKKSFITLPPPLKFPSLSNIKNLVAKNHSLKAKSKKRILTALYFGRNSFEKNLIPLIEHLIHTKKRMRLICVGPIDNYSLYHTDTELKLNEYFQIWKSFKKYVSKLRHFKLLEVPETDQDGIFKYCQEADFFISLSTFHEEDYGLAPREALIAGCPLILSSWGGYKDLASSGADIRYVRVKKTGKFAEFEHQDLSNAINFFTKDNYSLAVRKTRSKKYKKLFSNQTYVDSLNLAFKNQPFSKLKGPKNILKTHSKKILNAKNKLNKLYSDYDLKDKFYKKIYASYY
jgi:glycosyltransferase involved in cell wall biosynthesis